MNKRMKQFGSLVLALAMILSLSVTALAQANNTPTVTQTETDQQSTVKSEGKLPDDVVDVVMPTAPASGGTGLFSMIFDTHGMISETDADRYAGNNDGRGVAAVDDSRFFFKNYVKTVNDKPFTLKAGFGTGDNYIADGTTVVQFSKPTASTGEVSIYAKYGPDGKFSKWLDSTGAEITDWTTGNPAKVAGLKDLDPASGYGLDAIAKINQEAPTLYLQKKGTYSGTTTALVGTIEYTFIASYDSTATGSLYIAFKDDGSILKTFSDLGTAATASADATPPTATTDPTLTNVEDATDNTINVKEGKATSGSDVYYRQLQYTAVLSLKKTSAPLEVINKTNAKIGVTVSAEVANIPGGDGKVDPTTQKQTYVYAKAMDSGKFYDGPVGESTTNEIVGGSNGVPVFFFTLTATDNAQTPNSSTEVVTYDATAAKATVSVGAAIPGQPTFFEKKWVGSSEDSGKYEYKLADSAYAKRQADFNAMTFQFAGAIDADNTVWDTFATDPTVKVTWAVEPYTEVIPPVVDKPASIKSTMATTFLISENTENAVFIKATQGGVEIADSNITVANDASTGGTTSITVNKGIITGVDDIVFTFQAQDKAFRTVDVTLQYATPTP